MPSSASLRDDATDAGRTRADEGAARARAAARGSTYACTRDSPKAPRVASFHIRTCSAQVDR
eukprot:COSAG02_NODE_9794_length_2109_cov_1.378607_2_plen_62_part_00